MKIIITTPNHLYREIEGDSSTLLKHNWEQVMRNIINTESINESKRQERTKGHRVVNDIKDTTQGHS